ncbi:MAG: hypothetical protein WBN65_10160 [Gammaproteobacteria bacterium]
MSISLNGGRTRLAYFLRILTLIAIASPLAACGPDAPPPEQAIESLVQQAEDAGEAGDVDGLLALLSSEYHDIDGRDRRKMGFLLRTLLARYPDSVVLVRGLEVALISDELASANMQVFVVARDQGSAAALDLDGERLWMRLDLRREGSDWLVTRAQWRRDRWN